MEIRPALDLGAVAREKISELFVDGFYDDLKMFSKDRARLARAFAHMFLLRYFYVALVDGEIAGVAACLGAEDYCVKFDQKELVRHLGLFRGLFAGFAFKYLGHSPKYPPEAATDERTGSIEFVATGSLRRKKGVAAAILGHLHSLPEYAEHVLEVKDTNAAAVALYEKLGYREVFRRKFRWSKRADFDYFVYMKRPRA